MPGPQSLVVREVSKALRSLIDTSLPKPSEIDVKFSGFSSTCENPNLRHYSDANILDVRYPNSNGKIIPKKIPSDLHSTKDLHILMKMQYLDPETLQKIDIVGDVKIFSDSKNVLEKVADLKRFQQISFIGDEGKSGVAPEPLTLSLKSPPVVSKLFRVGRKTQNLAEFIKLTMRENELERFHFHGLDEFPVTLPRHFTQPEFFKVKGIPANIRFQKIQENQFWRIELTPKLITVEKVDHFY
ncbi:unnamed protein product [Caenorhabditis brenneri]